MEDSPSKPSVAELAGRFKGHILPMPNPNEELPFRRRPPCSLKLRNQTDNSEESDKGSVFPAPPKIKTKNSAIIEKLQANLALSPTALLPSPKNPEVKLQPAAPLSPATARSPMSPLTPNQQPSHPSSEEEEPVGFDGPPPDGALLPSFNKTRPRLSFKRRPPTRKHRRSAGDESGAFGGGGGGGLSQGELCSPRENGDKERDSDDQEEEADDARSDNGENRDADCGEMDGVAAAAEDEVDPQRDTDDPESSDEEKPKRSDEEEEEKEERENDGM
ncbi:unnamed protein product [Ophioblennius macclurei]